MRRVYLYGALGRKYGKVFDLEISNPAEAVRALGANIEGFIEDIRKGNWHVVIGKTWKDGLSLSAEELSGFCLGQNDVHIMPKMSGSKKNGLLKLIVGAALVAVAFSGAPFLATAISGQLLGATTWGNALGMIGMSMALSGISQMLTPQSDSKDEQKSYLMSGPTSSQGQGQAIPIIYGEVITGGVMVSGGIDVQPA